MSGFDDPFAARVAHGRKPLVHPPASRAATREQGAPSTPHPPKPGVLARTPTARELAVLNAEPERVRVYARVRPPKHGKDASIEVDYENSKLVLPAQPPIRPQVFVCLLSLEYLHR